MTGLLNTLYPIAFFGSFTALFIFGANKSHGAIRIAFLLLSVIASILLSYVLLVTAFGGRYLRQVTGGITQEQLRRRPRK
ncbi:MAG: hypothetical protein QOD57_4375 [Actinomycetota bacterium]|jgi:predicted permease|nr:hypothetical protein [Actinomycetota bacterium]MDQ1499103.1 hypothetical protein [Actinomycetota bacterium]MDQ1506648.1 hypothetical protein [Actinomycetota bacterium]